MQTRGDEGTGGFVIPATVEMVLYHARLLERNAKRRQKKNQISKLIHQIERFISKIKKKHCENKLYSHVQKWQKSYFPMSKKVAIVPWCSWKSLYPSKERLHGSYPPPV